jgi:hypothetical protein
VNFKILKPNILVLLEMFMGIHGLHPPWKVEAITLLRLELQWVHESKHGEKNGRNIKC